MSVHPWINLLYKELFQPEKLEIQFYQGLGLGTITVIVVNLWTLYFTYYNMCSRVYKSETTSQNNIFCLVSNVTL